MHSLYQEQCNLSLPWVMSYLFPWELFCLRFSDDDLRLVVRWIKDRKRNGRPARDFTFRNFIAGPSSLDFFAEDLAQAKAESRTPLPTPRSRALEAIGRPVPVADKVRSTGQILAERAKMALMLRKFRENL